MKAKGEEDPHSERDPEYILRASPYEFAPHWKIAGETSGRMEHLSTIATVSTLGPRWRVGPR